ncbi:hypothetical protein PHLH7_07670 [Pseudomonas sp. Ost2]|uniref:hypothetical protein n=1 Tax=Pseudomonas sp. Ost2 TaxID=2678260 RepID=UPI001BF14574|nr:hypothetical protein [Pseudomonas sp. Ost2]BBP74663.1 hypothetical protein PHLH7_07670 [Pseudomonas sp. Ost2]
MKTQALNTTADPKAFNRSPSGAPFAVLLKTGEQDNAVYRQARPDEKAPALSGYASIEKPDTLAADTVRFVTRDGDHVLVSKASNPGLYQQVVADQKLLPGLTDSLAQGYQLAAGDASAPGSLADYKAIGAADEMGPGLIRYETGDGHKVIVAERDNPELFKQVSEDFKALGAINASEADGYHRAGADDTPPGKLGDFKSVGPADEVGPGLIRYETQDGNKVIVSERDNPALFEQAKDAYASLSGLTASEGEGYRRAGDNEVWPPVDGTIVGPKDEVGPDTIRYESDGKKVVVARDDNPKLFDYLVGLYDLKSDPGKLAALQSATDGGSTLADQNTPQPGLNDYKGFGWIEGQQGNVLTYETHDGKRMVVSADLTPELFKSVATAHDTWDKIHTSEGEGYKLAGPNDFLKNTDITFGSPDELGNGLIRYETSEGKVIVSKELSPQLYEEVVGKWEAWSAGTVDETRGKYNLPPKSELDVLNLKTGVHADEKDSNSPELSVSELATKELLDTYRAGVADGSIAKDDPRARLVRALEAQAAYQNGRGITGYEEEPGAFGGTWRVFDDKQTELTSADMHDIIDGPALQKQLATLFADPTVQADYKGKMDDAINHLPNKDEIKQKLLDLTANPDYITYLKDLQNQGKTHEAQQDLSDTLTSLSLFDPDAASKAAQSIQADGLTTDLNGILADPSKISDDNKELATKDLFGLLKGVLKGSLLDLPRRSQEVIEKFLTEGLQGKEKASAVTKALEELGAVYKANGSISEADLNTALNKPYIPIADRGTLGEVFNTLNNKGILGSLGAGVTLFSAIYQLVGKGGKLGETPAQRMTIAKDFLSFAGASSHFVKLGDKIGEALGKGGLVDFLGLDKTLPEIWGKTGTQAPNFEFRVSDLPADVKAKISTALDAVPDSKYDGIAELFGDGDGAKAAADNVTDGLTTHLDDALSAAGGAKLSASKAAKIAGSVIKVLGPATDIVGGFADIVLGAFTIKSGVETNDPLSKAAGGLQVAGGAFGASAGVLGAAALFGAGSAAALTGPFFLVGVVLAVVGGIVGYFVDHNKKQKASEKENDWYRELAGDGVLQDNWADKVEYAHYSIHHYGGREAPTDDSLFRFQDSEWEHFDQTPQKGGSSSNRLDDDLHVDYGD